MDYLTTIPDSWICDDISDCGDGSDEADCSDIYFQCLIDSVNIPANYECDFYVDCSDASDESSCPGTRSLTRRHFEFLFIMAPPQIYIS